MMCVPGQRERGILTILPEDTYLDEVIGWSLAALGLWSQLASGTYNHARTRARAHVVRLTMSLRDC